jgi:hypothetical protein
MNKLGNKFYRNAFGPDSTYFNNRRNLFNKEDAKHHFLLKTVQFGALLPHYVWPIIEQNGNNFESSCTV